MPYHQSGEQCPQRPNAYRQGHAQQQQPVHHGYQQQHPQIPQFQQQQWQPRRFRREQYWHQEQGYPQYQQHYQQQYPQQQHHQTEHPQQYGPPQYPQQHDQYQQQQYHQPEQPQQQHGFQQFSQQYDQHQQPQQQGPPRYPQQPRQQQHWRQKRFEKDVKSQSQAGTPGKAATEKIDAQTFKKNKGTKADGSKIPLKVLKQALGHVISAETVNGYIVKGKLTDIQVINMNCELSQWLDENNEICHVTSSRPSKKVVKMYDVLFVRGSMVRYWILPDVLINYTTTLITEFVKQRQEILDLKAAKMGNTPGLKRPQENPILEPLPPIQIVELEEDKNAEESDWFVIGKKEPKEDQQSPKQTPTEGQRSRKSSPSDTAPISEESPTKASHPSREESQTTQPQPGGSTQVAKLVTPQKPITVRTTAPVEKPSYYHHDYHPTVPMKRQSSEAPSHIQGQKSRKSLSAKENDWDPISKDQQGHPINTQPQPGGSSQVPSVRPQSTEYGPQYPIEVRSSAPGPGFHNYYTYTAPVPVNRQSREASSRQGSQQIPTVTGQMQHPMQYQVPGLGMTPPRPVYMGMQPPYPLLPGPVEGQLLYPPRRQLPQYPQYSSQVQHPPQIQQPYPMLTYPAVVPQFIPSYPGPVLVEPSALPPPPEVIQQTVVNVRGKEILATEIGGCTYFDEPPPKP